MPMESNTFWWPCNLIVDGDLDGIAPICFNQRTWKLPIDNENIFEISVRGFLLPLDGEVIGSNHTEKIRSGIYKLI